MEAQSFMVRPGWCLAAGRVVSRKSTSRRSVVCPLCDSRHRVLSQSVGWVVVRRAERAVGDALPLKCRGP